MSVSLYLRTLAKDDINPPVIRQTGQTGKMTSKEWRKLQADLHPDRGPRTPEQMAELFKQLNNLKHLLVG